MKIGFPTHPRKDIISEIKWIAENKFDFIDLFFEPDKCEIQNYNPEQINEIITQYNMETVGHTAWYLPTGSPLKELRDASVKIINDHIVFLSKINCKKMTVHANWPPTQMFTEDEGINFQNDSLKKIISFAKNNDIKIMLEPISTLNDTVENIEKILNDNPDLYFHLDIGHASLYGRNALDFIKKFKSRMIHIHLHDNNGLQDLHLPLGCGKINWKSVIDEIKPFYKETITLEIFSGDRAYVLLSKEKLIKYINNN